MIILAKGHRPVSSELCGCKEQGSEEEGLIWACELFCPPDREAEGVYLHLKRWGEGSPFLLEGALGRIEASDLLQVCS